MKTLEDFLLDLKGKGFQFGEDAVGFIYFGKQYTGSTDELTIIAIELTLKSQKKFDGSFYISLLEMFPANNIKTRKQAIRYVKQKQLLPI
ncbi:DUF6123 family protein [Mesobacillus foraminis]|uniref:Uncharacterized protein n=1 Tax=Mesobacillus foraminis TaxID=279826 RepID=A0A4R2B995_9BACI|nr:DUF6123 family protein [Mesobacillus foraminis]MBT2754978.1 hypothetical protein [Mesobacillus foraminis]TCN23116.1 hypothetical protein EV146_109276 [Mesobacillus foraminis]